MSLFTVDQTVTVALVRQKSLFVGTGAQIAALTTYAGMLVFCTATGSGFTINVLYQRNAANSAWLEVATLAAGGTVTNKTISGSSNTLTNFGTGAFNDNSVAMSKVANAVTAYGKVTSSSNFTTTSTSFEDVSGMSVTITATGNRSALITECSCSCGGGQSGFTAITDDSNNQKAVLTVSLDNGGTNGPRSGYLLAAEAAPSAGSITRKMRFQKYNIAGTYNLNTGALTNGVQLCCYELL